LLLEPLEDRVVPTVVFDPQFAKETVSAAPYTVVNNPTVYLIFWGSPWGPSGSLASAVGKLTNDATAVINSKYFGGLAEYGNIGTVSYGGAWTDSSSNPPSGFNVGSAAAITAEQAGVTSALTNNSSWVANSSSIFVVIPVGGSSGYNAQGTATYQGSSVTVNICSVGGASNPNTTPGTTTEDWFTQTFSHEMAERISDPGAGGVSVSYSTDLSFPGYVGYFTPNVNNDPTRTDNQTWMADGGQIGDGEQELSGDQHYGYRLNGVKGVKVQSFWSAKTLDSSGSAGAFIVPDGNTKAVYLQPVWSTTSVTLTDPTGGGGAPAVFNAPFFNVTDKYDLLIKGTSNDTVTINAGDGQTTVNLDGQNFVFASLIDGGQIRNITVDGGSGSNTFTIQALAADQRVEIDSVGSDTINIGNNGDLTGVLGTVQVVNTANTTPATTVNIDDSSDGQNTDRTVTLDQIGDPTTPVHRVIFSGLGTIEVNPDSVSNLNITGYAFGNTFNVVSTIDLATTSLNTDGSNDTVTVHSTSGALTIYNPNGVDTVTIGDASNGVQNIGGPVTLSGSGTQLIVDDSGDTTPQPNPVYWTPQSSVIISSSQITGLGPTAINFGQGSLSSLTVKAGSGGTAFSVLGTPAPTTIQAGTGNDSISVGDASHNLSNMGIVTGEVALTVNGNGNTTLEVNDAGNAVTPQSPLFPPGSSSYVPLSTSFTIDSGLLTRSAMALVNSPYLPPGFQYPFLTQIAYGGLASLTLDGGPAVAFQPTTYSVLNTAGTNAVIFNAHGSDSVTVGDASHNLSNLGIVTVAKALTVNGNGNTTLEVNDAGNAVTPQSPLFPPGSSSYVPLSTSFTIDSGLLTRSAMALVNSPYLPPGFQYPFLTQIAYGGLASLTLDGGPAVPVTPTPYQLLNTPGSAPVTINAHGTDAVTVGDANNTINGIQGAVTVNGNGANTTLNVHDDGNNVTENYSVFPTSIQRSIIVAGVYDYNTAAINYYQVGHVAVYVGSAQTGLNQGAQLNTLDVFGTEAGTTTDVYGNNAGQTQSAVAPYDSPEGFNANNQILGAVHFHSASGGIGLDTLSYYDYLDQAAQSYAMTATAAYGQIVDMGPIVNGQIVGTGFAPVTYDGPLYGAGLLTSVVGGSTVSLSGTYAALGFGTQVQANTGDKVTVGSNGPALGGTLSQLGRMIIATVAPTQSATFILDDSGDLDAKGNPNVETASYFNDGYTYGLSGLSPSRIYCELGAGSNLQILGSGNSMNSLTATFPGDFNQNWTVSGFSTSAGFTVPGNFSGSLLALGLGTATTPIQQIQIGGTMAAGAKIKVNYLGSLSVAGDLAGMVNGYGNSGSQSQPTIGPVTIGGNFSGMITAPIIESINMQPASSFSGNASETAPGADFQSLVLGTVTSTGMINAGAVANATVAGDMAGQINVSGTLGTLGIGGNLSGSVTAPFVSSVSIGQDLTGRLTASQALWPGQPTYPPTPIFPSGWVPPNPCTVTIAGALASTGVVQADDLASLSVGKDAAGYVAVAGPIGTFSVAGSVSGSVFAYSIGSTSIQGSLSGVETGLQSLYPPTSISPSTSTINSVYIGDSVTSIGTLSAPVLDTITVTNTMAGSILETSSFDIYQLAIGGSLAGSGRVLAPRIDTLSVGQDLAGQVTVTGALNTSTVGGNLTGSVAAATIGSVSVGLNLTGQVSASQSLGTVAAGGTITGNVAAPTIQQATVNGTATGNDTFILTPSSVVLNGSTILSGTFSSLTVQGGGGNELFQIQGGAVPATIAAGSGNDTFQFFTGAGISGTLDGGGGTNTLDYSAYAGDIVVNLPLGTATGVGGGIAHIQDVIGSQGNDLIVGNANASVLQGGTGRSLIIGGAAADAIYGGGGDSLLIGGTTDYDTNLAALDAIMAEWTRTDLGFDQRVNDIRMGGGSLAGTGYHLDSTTVHADPLTDQIWGGSGRNWFFAASPSEIDGGAGPGANDRYTHVK
jgi:hypothetical protein